jgi:hypothetical protein
MLRSYIYKPKSSCRYRNNLRIFSTDVHTNILSPINKIIKDYQIVKTDITILIDQLEKKQYDMFRLKIYASIIVIVFMFMFWRTIKSFISQQTSDVANKTMNNEEFKKNVFQLLDHIILYAQSDPLVQKKITELLVVILDNARKDPELMDSLNKIISDAILSEQTLADSNKLIQAILTDENNKKTLADTLRSSSIKALIFWKN